MAAIVLIRSDIPDGVLQVTDLWPNASQRNQIYDPQPQGPAYLRAVQNDTVAALVASGLNDATASAASGLAAYLLDRIADGAVGAGLALSVADANSIAGDIITEANSGNALTEAAVDAVIAAVAAGYSIAASGVASLRDILNILGGAQYVLPAGTAINVTATSVKLAAGGSFTAGVYRELFATDSLLISSNVGVLSGLKSSSFSYKGVTGAAVSVYDDLGNAL